MAAFPDLTPGLTITRGSLSGSGKSGALTNKDYSKWLWSFASPDHVVPLAHGGPHTVENLVTSCSGCNYSKDAVTLEQLDVPDPREDLSHD